MQTHQIPATFPPSLVTPPPPSHRTQTPRSNCTSGPLLQVSCGHGAQKYINIPCHRWRCPDCAVPKLFTDLLPQITRSFLLSANNDATLKFMTFTWIGRDTGAQPSPDGAKRRRLDLAHFSQTMKREHRPWGYLKVPELHQSGMVHLHAVGLTPFLNQAHFSDMWARHTRGAFRTDIRAVGFKCPSCWDDSIKDDKLRRQRMVVYTPGKGDCRCRQCSYVASVEDATAATSESSMWELGKYLVKNPAGRLYPNHLWRETITQVLQKNKLDLPSTPCTSCNAVHTFTLVPPPFDRDIFFKDYAPHWSVLASMSWRQATRPCSCWHPTLGPLD